MVIWEIPDEAVLPAILPYPISDSPSVAAYPPNQVLPMETDMKNTETP